jgi:hypothetical protein
VSGYCLWLPDSCDHVASESSSGKVVDVVVEVVVEHTSQVRRQIEDTAEIEHSALVTAASVPNGLHAAPDDMRSLHARRSWHGSDSLRRNRECAAASSTVSSTCAPTRQHDSVPHASTLNAPQNCRAQSPQSKTPPPVNCVDFVGSHLSSNGSVGASCP